MRNCPVCKIPLHEIPFQDQLVDQCERCKGLFFDKGELEAIVTMMKLFSAIKLDERDIDADDAVAPERETLTCPGGGSDMKTRRIGELIIDVCPSCDGVWLDGGELTALKMAEKNIRENMNLYIRLGS